MLGLSLPTKHNICIITSGLLVYLCGLFVENVREAERDADKATLLWTPECLDHSLTVQECKCLFRELVIGLEYNSTWWWCGPAYGGGVGQRVGWCGLVGGMGQRMGRCGPAYGDWCGPVCGVMWAGR